jgi:hypothetical protein
VVKLPVYKHLRFVESCDWKWPNPKSKTNQNAFQPLKLEENSLISQQLQLKIVFHKVEASQLASRDYFDLCKK